MTVVGLVIYVMLVGAVVSASRDRQLTIVDELERTHRREELLVQVNMAVARAILTVNDNYIAEDTASTVQPIAIEVEAVQSNLQGLRGDFPALEENISGLQFDLDHLRQTPSRGDIALIRNQFHELVVVLDRITSGERERKQTLLAAYRKAQDAVTLEAVLFSLFGLLVLGTVTALFFSQLTWDIRKLADRAMAIVQGYRGEPLPLTRGDEVGELMGAVNTMQSELRRHEAQMELARQQHFHREKMAAVGSLAAQLAHEINNPIAAIAGVAQSICEARGAGQCSNRTPQCHPELILDQARRVAAITRQIAEFTAPHSPEPQLLDLNGLVRSTCTFVGYDRRFRGIALTTDLDLQLPAVNAVGDHLVQVLMNLLINAADALGNVSAREREIVVATRALADRVALSVSDNGEGIPARNLEKVFDEYFTTKPTGSGIGLALCKKLLETCGASIRLDSEVQRGTTATVEIPLLHTENAA